MMASPGALAGVAAEHGRNKTTIIIKNKILFILTPSIYIIFNLKVLEKSNSDMY
jgi:hypothetical protein